MNAVRRIKAWWIADCPDDVARAQARGDQPPMDPEVAEALLRHLRRDLEESEARCRELGQRTNHYRQGWMMQAPFIEYRDSGLDVIAPQVQPTSDVA